MRRYVMWIPCIAFQQLYLKLKSGHQHVHCPQIALGTDDVYKTAEVVKLFGGKVVREPGPLPGINTKITSILDPDGWKSVSALLF